MNLNIFLKQFRRSNEEIIEMIKKADVRAFGVEKLKGLIKLLPQQDEVSLKEFSLIFSFLIFSKKTFSSSNSHKNGNEKLFLHVITKRLLLSYKFIVTNDVQYF